MEEKINLEDLIKKAEEEAREAYEQGGEKTLTVKEVIAALGGAAEAYIYCWHNMEGEFPGKEEKRAAISMILGTLAILKVHEAFGIGYNGLLQIAENLYGAALSNAVSKMAGGKDEYRVNIINIKREPNPGEPEED